MASSSAKSKRVNPIGNFLVAMVDGDVMKKFIEENDVPSDKVDPNGTPEQIAVALSLYFKETTPHDDLCKCDRCEGETPGTLDACPLCGLEGEAEDASEANVDGGTAITDPEALAANIKPQEGGEVVPIGSSKKAKKGAVARVNEDAPSTKVTPPPAEPKRAKEDAEMTTAKKKSSSKTTALAVAGSAELATKFTTKDLDERIERVFKLKSMAALSYWALGKEIGDINEKKLWKLRTSGASGKAKYTSFEAFVEHELRMSSTHAYDLMNVAMHYTKEDVESFGTRKFALILKAPPDVRPSLEAEVRGGATKSEIAEKVSKARSESGYTSPKKQAKGGKAGAKVKAKKAAAAKPATSKPASDKITVVSIEGKKRVALYAKPDSIRGVVDLKTLKRAKTIDAQPWGRIELANEVVLFVSMVKTDKGLEAIIDIRRDEK